MKIINHLILIDDQDKHLLDSNFRLHSAGYAATGNGKLLHRLVMPSAKYVDHINGNKLDNRRSNLRACNQSQNSANAKISKNNTTGYKGVCYTPQLHKSKPYMAYIMKDRKRIHIGYFNTAQLASKAYFNKAQELFGEFARLA